MSVYTNRDQQRFATNQELGRGGEGTVYTLASRTDVVAKIYHPDHRTAERVAKLEAMLAKPPIDSCRAFAPPHISLAWPTDVLLDNGSFAGFLMPRIERSPNIFALFNPKLRQLRFPQVDRRFLYHTAQNLAAAIHALHAAGCVMGDVNQKNILVKANTLVTLVDTDSFQVQGVDGTVYRCPVGVPDYTPPELQGKTLDQVDRQSHQDCFGLGVLLFQLLMEGYHPFTGKPLTSRLSEIDQLSLHCMQQGIFPYQQNAQVQPPADAPRFTWLHPDLQQLFLHCFLTGYTQPAQRPTALAWARALGKAEAALVQCRHQPAHWHGQHLGHCPYCQQQSAVVAATQRPPTRSPLMRPRSVPASQAQPAPQAGGWWQIVFKVLGFVYLLPLIFRFVVGFPWFFLAVALAGALLYPASRRVVWPALKTICAFGWSLSRHLASALLRLGQGSIIFWHTRTPRFKRVVFVMAALAFFWGVIGGDGNSALQVDGQIQPAQAGWVYTSPLPTPAGGQTQFTSPLR